MWGESVDAGGCGDEVLICGERALMGIGSEAFMRPWHFRSAELKFKLKCPLRRVGLGGGCGGVGG